VRTLRIVADEAGVEVALLFFNSPVPCGAAHHSAEFVQQGAVQPHDESVTLGPPSLGGAMVDALELLEALIRGLDGLAIEFPPVVVQVGFDGVMTGP